MAKTSHSQNSTYISCPKHWHLSYKEGWESPVQGASLFFGSAIDAAVTDMLEGKSNWLITFYDRWNKAYSFGKATPVFDNDDVVYGHKDMDKDILEQKDFVLLETWAKELNLIDPNSTPSNQHLIDIYKDCAETKKNPYKMLKKTQLKYFNRASWLSMKRKGKILLEAFNTQFYPKITKVLATQQRADIKDPNTGDVITGFVDMVLEISDYPGKPIIFDLKTAAMPYSQDDIDLTQQLTLYSAMKGKDYNTDLVGYVVLCKNIPKDVVAHCDKCGNKRNGRHKTCDAVVNNTRCTGNWIEQSVPAPVVQVLVEQKSQKQVNDLLLDIGNIMLAMDNGIVYKNVDKCKNWFGGQCPMYNLCHHGDSTGLNNKKANKSNGP